jgi:hypothetical protein
MGCGYMRLALIGPGRSGKGEAALWLQRNTRLRYWGPTSKVIAPHAAARLGVSEAEAFRRRHEDRALWRAIGDELRANDPAALARVTLTEGDICEGVRSRVEIEAVVREKLVDTIWWIDRSVAPDETLEFGIEYADAIIPNRGRIEDLYTRLRRLSAALGILRAS